MDLRNSPRLCRMCLCSSKQFIDVLEENGDLGFIVAKTIEDLLRFKVKKVGNYPWLACSTCLEKLIDFKLFKSRCVDSVITFEKRFFPSHTEVEELQGNQQVVLNEREEEVKQENDLGDEEGSNASKMCHALTEAETGDHLPSAPSGQSYEKNVESSDTCSNAGMVSWEHNSIGQGEDMVIEENNIVKVEPDAKDAVESGSINSFVERSLEIKDEPNDIEESDSAYTPEVPGTCGVDSIPSDADVAINYVLSEQCQSKEGEGNESAVSMGNRMVRSKGESSNKPEDGNQSVVEGFICVFCSAVFDSENEVRDHITEHHGHENVRWRDKSRIKPPPTNTMRLDHVELVDSGPLNLSVNLGGVSSRLDSVAQSMSIPRTPLQPRTKSYECKICSKKFLSLKVYVRHSSSCNQKFQCTRCKKNFKSASYVSLHMAVNESGKEFSCPKCPQIFQYKCALKAHRKVHAKLFICQDCDFAFDRSYSLKEHKLTHCKVKPVICKDCQETFIGSYAFRKHRIEVHNGR